MRKVIAFLMALMFVLPACAEELDVPVLQVHQMALGFADGYLIRCGDVDILIDGGNPQPAQPTDDVVNYLHAAGVDKLDAYIITHWHLDHCMNMNPVLAEFGDDHTRVYGPSETIPEKIFNGTVTVAIGRTVNGVYQQMKMGDVLELNGLTITCIGPKTLTQDGGCNPDSLNFVLQYGQRKFLFTGDFAQSGCIINEYKELCSDVDVLKFPHHGNMPYEIGQKASRVVRPAYVLVPGVTSVHKLWDFFDNIGVKFSRDNVLTNANGHVVILTDGGDRFDVMTQQNPVDYAPQTN